MKLEWMGENRDQVEAMIRFGNVYSRIISLPGYLNENIMLTATEIQVLEYLIENDELNLNMIQVASRLEIKQSYFSKICNKLCQKGLLEKFHIKGNYKNIIMKPTESGYELYREYSSEAATGWKPIFDELNKMSAEDRERFSKILNLFSIGSMERLNKFTEKDKKEEILIPVK